MASLEGPREAKKNVCIVPETGVEVASGLLREGGGTYWSRRAGKTWESFPCSVPSQRQGGTRY